MRRRLATLLAALALVSLAALGFTGIAQAKSDSADGTRDKCETSKEKANGCDEHPGEHDDDDDDGSSPSCADLPDQALIDLCEALTGGGGGGEDPSCASLPDQALIDLCEALTGGGGGGEDPSCASLPD